MKTSDVLKIETFLLDLDLNILSSTVRGVKGSNFYDVIQYQKIAIKDFISGLRDHQSIQLETFLILKNGVKLPYTLIVYRSPTTYFVTAIAQDEINKLIATTESLEEFAYTDQLTGALNRYAYWKLLEWLIYDLERLNLGLGVVFLDVDNLKHINTSQGYPGGDNAIAFVAKCATQSLRKYDLLVRLGGDEFLALFRIDPTKDFTVEDMANRILNRVRKDSNGEVSVSIGAHYIKPGLISKIVRDGKWKKDWENVIDDLDKKLRKAKREGKGRVTISI
ncbi:GGDEF domain-containing protein [Candidatus Dojkabacteria bacterium]|nr:GGDEF domain-containing protein [Candidatus Dojkabacteria bacterium]